MIARIEDNLEAIQALCREFGVQRLELVGSAATGRFAPDGSDLDFLVDYPPGYDFGLWLALSFVPRSARSAARLPDRSGYGGCLAQPARQ